MLPVPPEPLDHHWDPADPDPRSLQELCAAVGAQRDVDLGALTTLKVGGRAAGLLEVRDATHLVGVLEAATHHRDVPVLIVGRGSNLLVSDDGFPGLALRLGEGLRRLSREGAVVTAGGAAAMPALAAWCAEQGLRGLEFAAGVPASVGGAVCMNAGAHGAEVAEHLTRVQLATAAGVVDVDPAELHLRYRASALPAGAVVVGASWTLAADLPSEVAARVEEVRAWRREHQPIGERTCGSTFTNPSGDSAGRLVQECGLKGHRLGSARVSPRHANFIEADRRGRAADVLALIRHVRDEVWRLQGVLLQPEVRIVGHFST
jgi:UDP-N-acetylmuramate dehydrogenase